MNQAGERIHRARADALAAAIRRALPLIRDRSVADDLARAVEASDLIVEARQ